MFGKRLLYFLRSYLPWLVRAFTTTWALPETILVERFFKFLRWASKKQVTKHVLGNLRRFIKLCKLEVFEGVTLISFLALLVIICRFAVGSDYWYLVKTPYYILNTFAGMYMFSAVTVYMFDNIKFFLFECKQIFVYNKKILTRESVHLFNFFVKMMQQEWDDTVLKTKSSYESCLREPNSFFKFVKILEITIVFTLKILMLFLVAFFVITVLPALFAKSLYLLKKLLWLGICYLFKWLFFIFLNFVIVGSAKLYWYYRGL